MVSEFDMDLFTNPDYSLVQCWVHATVLSPDTINQTEPQTYHCTNFSEDAVGDMPFGIPCNQFMAVVDFPHAALLLAVTAYLGYEGFQFNLMLQCYRMPGLTWHSWTNSMHILYLHVFLLCQSICL